MYIHRNILYYICIISILYTNRHTRYTGDYNLRFKAGTQRISVDGMKTNGMYYSHVYNFQFHRNAVDISSETISILKPHTMIKLEENAFCYLNVASDLLSNQYSANRGR